MNEADLNEQVLQVFEEAQSSRPENTKIAYKHKQAEFIEWMDKQHWRTLRYPIVFEVSILLIRLMTSFLKN